MTLDDVIAYQREHDLGDTHVVYFGAEHFHIAHTEAERLRHRDNGVSLYDCLLHIWIADNLGGPPPSGTGLYAAERHQPDGYSESYRGDAGPWDFTRLEVSA